MSGSAFTSRAVVVFQILAIVFMRAKTIVSCHSLSLDSHWKGIPASCILAFEEADGLVHFRRGRLLCLLVVT